MLMLIVGFMQTVLMAPAPLHKESMVYKIEVQVLQGYPDNASQAGKRYSPALVIRNGDLALMNVGQQVALAVDKMAKPTAKPDDPSLKKVQIVEQIGLLVRLTPHQQENGMVYLQGDVQLKDIVKDLDDVDQILERSVKVNKLCKLGDKVKIPFYILEDYIVHSKQPGSDEIKKIMKPYTGNEVWAEIVVTEQKP